jgi:hypothetical protein
VQRLNRWRQGQNAVELRTYIRRAWYLAVLRRWRPWPRPGAALSSDVPVDVLIPVAEKDLPLLPHVLRALRAHLRHPLAQILIVAPESSAVRAVCRAEGAQFMPETGVLPLSRADLEYTVNGQDRSGWLWQQLIKLYADQICTQPHVLVADADTLLLQPHCFVRRSRTLLLFADEFHVPYYRTYRRLLGQRPISPVSFVSHYMLLHGPKLVALRAAIEARHQAAWYHAILAQIDRSIATSFSEFETYGNFVLAHYPESVWLEYSANRMERRRRASELPGLADALRGRYRSLSFHSHFI